MQTLINGTNIAMVCARAIFLILCLLTPSFSLSRAVMDLKNRLRKDVEADSFDSKQSIHLKTSQYILFQCCNSFLSPFEPVSRLAKYAISDFESERVPGACVTCHTFSVFPPFTAVAFTLFLYHRSKGKRKTWLSDYEWRCTVCATERYSTSSPLTAVNVGTESLRNCWGFITRMRTRRTLARSFGGVWIGFGIGWASVLLPASRSSVSWNWFVAFLRKETEGTDAFL